MYKIIDKIRDPVLVILIFICLMIVQSLYQSNNILNISIGSCIGILILIYGIYQNQKVYTKVPIYKTILSVILGIFYIGVGILVYTSLTYTQNDNHIPTSITIPMYIYVLLIGPIIEEVLFRQVLYSDLLRKWDRPFGILISGLIFISMHFPSTLSELLYYMMATIGIYVAYEISGQDLRIAIVVHMLNNLYSLL